MSITLAWGNLIAHINGREVIIAYKRTSHPLNIGTWSSICLESTRQIVEVGCLLTKVLHNRAFLKSLEIKAQLSKSIWNVHSDDKGVKSRLKNLYSQRTVAIVWKLNATRVNRRGWGCRMSGSQSCICISEQNTCQSQVQKKNFAMN